MAGTTLSAIVAVLSGFVLASLLVIPYVMWTYRRRGEFGLGHAMLALTFLVYLMALWTYTLLPIPDQDAAWCAAHAASTPQLLPFQFVRDIVDNQAGTGLGSILRNPAVQQVVFNVAFFVPLGMFCRHLLRWRAWAVVAAGFATSLLIEFTQLTGVWFLFECPYRLFDVDDLLANTAGAALGVLLAPLLRIVPGQRVRLDASAPRPVTGRRRLLGIVLDVVLVEFVGAILGVATNALVIATHGDLDAIPAWVHSTTAYWLPVAVVVLLPILVGNGATPGQKIVRLRPVDAVGRPPARTRRLARFVVGAGGYFALLGLNALYSVAPLTILLVLVSLVMVWAPRDHRGLTGAIGGLRVRDERGPALGHGPGA